MAGFLAGAGFAKLGELSRLQRMLLVCDGTLTDLVEAAYDEPIRLVKLAVETAAAAAAVDELSLPAGSLVMRREILLQGARTGTNYVFAESLIAVNALPVALRDALLKTDAPLGRLWVEHRLETRKEILRVWRAEAAAVPQAGWIGSGAKDGLLARRYRVISGGRPVMLISEFLPVAGTTGDP